MRPTNLFSDYATLGEEEHQDEESKSQLEEDEKALAYMARLKGWKLLKEYIERIEADLDKMVLATIESGASYEEIGRKTAVKEIVKNVTRQIKERVGNATAARGPGT